jgi:hypothetical protein
LPAENNRYGKEIISLRSIISAVFNEVDDAEFAAKRVSESGIKIYKRRIEGTRKYVDEDEPLKDIFSDKEAFSLGAGSVILGSFPSSFAFSKKIHAPDYVYSAKTDIYNSSPRLIIETDSESANAVRRILRNSHGRHIKDMQKQ